MFELLIVDDEWSVIEHMSSAIDWEQAGIEAVHTAMSAEEAMEIIRRHEIQIMITDIQMPEMTGLELIEQVRGLNRRIRCLILSGHTEFHYAQEALRQQVHDYFIKPVRNETLLDAVRKLAASIRAEWEEIASVQRSMYTLRENLPHLRSRLLQELLQGKALTAQTLQEQLELIDLPFRTGQPYSMLLLRLEGLFDLYSSRDIALIEYAITNIADEVLSDLFELWHGKDSHDYLVILVTCRQPAEPGSQELLKQRVSTLHKNISAYLKGTTSIVVGQWQSFPDGLFEAYRQLTGILLTRLGADEQMIYSLTEPLQTAAADQVRMLRSLYQPPTLTHLLDTGRWAEAEQKLADIFREIQEESAAAQEYVFETFTQIFGAYMYFVHKNNRMLGDVVSEQADRAMQQLPFRSIPQLEAWSYQVLGLLKQSIEEESLEDRQNIIKQVHQYLNDHLSRDVSLQAVADHVALHPVYLSKVYKNITGDNLSEVILVMRMDRAAFLLKHTNDRIHVVAEKVGYPNSPYFAKVFRKHFGVTPQEYRNK